jgi:hypothetical protein
VAQSDAQRREQEAEAERLAVAAEKVKSAQASQEAYAAETTAEKARAEREKASQHADIIIPAEIEKLKIQTLAEADAEKIRRLKKGEADGVQSIMEAEAKGTLAALQSKAEGFARIVEASGGAEFASTLLVTEQLPQLVAEQVKAIANLKIDNITVWDSGKGEGGKNDTANFVSGLVGALPPLHQITKNVGIELPEFLGKLTENPTEAAKILEEAQAEEPKKKRPKSVDLDQASSIPALPSIEEQIEARIREDLSLIKTFDENRDGVLNDNEINNAVNKIKKWASESNGKGKDWLYYGTNNQIGPISWDEIIKVSNQYPEVFISKVEVGSQPKEKAINWLPIKIVLFAKELLSA